jgi:hypothetical protein
MKEAVEKRVNMMPARHVSSRGHLLNIFNTPQNLQDFRSSDASSANITSAIFDSRAR